VADAAPGDHRLSGGGESPGNWLSHLVPAVAPATPLTPYLAVIRIIRIIRVQKRHPGNGEHHGFIEPVVPPDRR
jgi:hypothetical protein